MKPNPKLNYFIENKIEEDKDNPYILWEEGDIEKLQTLIEETAQNKNVKEYLLERLERPHVPNTCPVDTLLDTIGELSHKRRDSGRKKIYETEMRLFPNSDELRAVYKVAKSIRSYNVSLRHIDWALDELPESLKATKEEN